MFFNCYLIVSILTISFMLFLNYQLSLNYIFRSSGSRTRTRMIPTNRGCHRAETSLGRKSGFIVLMKSNSFSTASWWGPSVFIRPLWTSRPGRYMVVPGDHFEGGDMPETGGLSARPRSLTGTREAPKSAPRQRAARPTLPGTAVPTGSGCSSVDLTRWVLILVF